jgi:PPOX class probable F420-dependent enzyme
VSAELSPAARAFVDAARVARLATIAPDGRLHVVPICHALDGDRILVATEPTQKVRNLEADPRVGLAFDDYDEVWSKLQSLSASGRAAVHRDGPVWARGRELLYRKFPQYPDDADRARADVAARGRARLGVHGVPVKVPRLPEQPERRPRPPPLPAPRVVGTID